MGNYSLRIIYKKEGIKTRSTTDNKKVVEQLVSSRL